jgi:hypothetical protein
MDLHHSPPRVSFLPSLTGELDRFPKKVAPQQPACWRQNRGAPPLHTRRDAEDRLPGRRAAPGFRDALDGSALQRRRQDGPFYVGKLVKNCMMLRSIGAKRKVGDRVS